MNENLNLVELLKDCPKGTKFYSSYLGKDVFFIGIHNNYIECEYHSTVDSPFNSMIQFRKEGSFFKDGECMIFPSKDQRDWSKWQRPFVDGDVVFSVRNLISIYKKRIGNSLCSYASLNNDTSLFINGNMWTLKNIRFATEEEKQKLFDVLKKEGYEWDAEKKELKTLQLFKDGDIVANNDGKYIAIIENNGGKYYVCCHPNVNYFNIDGSGWFDRLATEEEKATLFQAIKDKGYKWNAETKTLEKLIIPKFKIGDKIRLKENHNYIYTITDIKEKENKYECGVTFVLRFSEQNNWELIPNKFDSKTLQPFDKVLVRQHDERWHIQFFETMYEYDKNHPFRCLGGKLYSFCIPYAGNEYLLDTTDEPSEFYKY